MSPSFVGDHVEQASRWIYSGLWAVLVRWFCVPDMPPTLPAAPDEKCEAFQPSEGFLKYLKFKFWLVLTLLDGAILVLWVVIAAVSPAAGAITALPALAIAVLPDVVAYLAIHLRYDTTWYVMTRRSLRIRRGIWIIHETTITFENVQNVEVHQGPLQRWFGIADVLVTTAGGGSEHAAEGRPNASMTAHHGLIEGISHAPQVRDLILSRLRHSRTAGLGDEKERHVEQSAWKTEHLAVLREIRDLARAASRQ
ncbi:MAG TPA: PH domain-containing protein [Pirellulales bacterium]|jgi:membrane protein YdbS with pleckstrin-like domain|nr:PH domain-containing protein [Pirellulales bacterium]